MSNLARRSVASTPTVKSIGSTTQRKTLLLALSTTSVLLPISIALYASMPSAHTNPPGRAPPVLRSHLQRTLNKCNAVGRPFISNVSVHGLQRVLQTFGKRIRLVVRTNQANGCARDVAQSELLNHPCTGTNFLSSLSFSADRCHSSDVSVERMPILNPPD